MNKERIIKELQENPDGFTVAGMSRKLNISRYMVVKSFAFLEGAKQVKVRQTKMTKIYFWRDQRK